MTTAAAGARWFEDVRVGEPLPPVEKRVNLVNMVAYGAATWDFVRLHYDAAYAQTRGFPAPPVDGQMLGAFLAQLVQDWAGPRSRLWKLSFQNRAAVFEGDSVICRGAVRAARRVEGRNLVECDLWIDNRQGVAVVRPASATLLMPSRSEGA